MENENIVEVGRLGTVDTEKRIVDLELRHWSSKHSVSRVTGIAENMGLRLSFVRGEKYNMSSGGNGRERFGPLEPGIYYVQNAIDSSGRVSHLLIDLRSDEWEYHRDLQKEECRKFLREAFPSDYENARAAQLRIQKSEEEARKVVSEILEERKAYGVEIIDGVTAVPEFGDAPTIEHASLRILAQDWGDEQRDAYINSHAVPKHYVVQEPCFVKAKTAQEAVDQAREIAAKRAAEKRAAQEAAEAAGLPMLTGTPKQIAWAVTIRGKVAAKQPDLPALKKATTAKYWIENFRNA